jgi:uncharacterized cupredoxin-like copper-binding protein
MKSRFAAVAALALVIGSLIALPAGARTAHTSASAVTVTAGKPSEFRFTLSAKSVAHGAVTFTVLNKGKLPHNFKIAGKKTPNIASGKKAVLKVTFTKAGKYAYECAVPGHAAAGMKGVLVVK